MQSIRKYATTTLNPCNSPPKNVRSTIAAISAIKRLYAIPAKETAIAPLKSPFSITRPISTGTGFAHPNKKGDCNKKSPSGKMIEPKISMCLIGFGLSRPASFAVSSPYFSATNPCIISCPIMASKSTIIFMAKSSGLKSGIFNLLCFWIWLNRANLGQNLLLNLVNLALYFANLANLTPIRYIFLSLIFLIPLHL